MCVGPGGTRLPTSRMPHRPALAHVVHPHRFAARSPTPAWRFPAHAERLGELAGQGGDVAQVLLQRLPAAVPPRRVGVGADGRRGVLGDHVVVPFRSGRLRRGRAAESRGAGWGRRVATRATRTARDARDRRAHGVLTHDASGDRIQRLADVSHFDASTSTAGATRGARGRCRGAGLSSIERAGTTANTRAQEHDDRGVEASRSRRP